MREWISLANGGHLTMQDQTVGPRHDPYARTIIERHSKDGRMWRLVSCGLAGDWLEDGTGKKIAELKIYDINDAYGGTVEEANERRKLRAQAYGDAVDKFTGQRPYFWEHKVWELQYAHMSDDQRWMREADREMMRYAM